MKSMQISSEQVSIKTKETGLKNTVKKMLDY